MDAVVIVTKIITKHGSYTSYCQGCRCDLCQEARTKQMQDYRPRRAAAIVADPSIVKHGTNSTYTQGCRCDECKAASQVYRHNYYKPAQKKERRSSIDGLVCGTPYKYQQGCRCDLCTEANRKKSRDWARKKYAEEKLKQQQETK